MDQMTLVQLWVDTCPGCEIRIILEGELPPGRLLVCPNCDTNLGFIETNHTKWDWALPDEPERGDLVIEDLDEERDLLTLEPHPLW